MKDGGHMDDLRLVNPLKLANDDPEEVDSIGTLVLALGIPPPCQWKQVLLNSIYQPRYPHGLHPR